MRDIIKITFDSTAKDLIAYNKFRLGLFEITATTSASAFAFSDEAEYTGDDCGMTWRTGRRIITITCNKVWSNTVKEMIEEARK